MSIKFIRYPVILSFCLLFLYSCQKNSSIQKTENIDFIIGTWVYKTEHFTVEEFWQKKSKSEYIGGSHTINNNGDTLSIEKIEIKYQNKHWEYNPTVIENGTFIKKSFQISMENSTSFTAKNFENSFPKRIHYEKKSKDFLYAWIDDGFDERTKMTFYYVRKFNTKKKLII